MIANNNLILNHINVFTILSWCNNNGVIPIPCKPLTKATITDISSASIYGIIHDENGKEIDKMVEYNGKQIKDSFLIPTPERLDVITNFWIKHGECTITTVGVSLGTYYPTVDGYTIACVDVDNDEYNDIFELPLLSECPIFTGEKGGKVFFKLNRDISINNIIQYYGVDEKHPAIEIFTGQKHALIFGEHPHSTKDNLIFYKNTRFSEKIPVIAASDLLELFKDYTEINNLKLKNELNEFKIAKRSKIIASGGTITEKFNLHVEDFLMPTEAKKRGNSIFGKHPIHGGTSAAGNLHLNIRDNQWHCFRCNSGGGALEALAVSEGIIQCNEAKPGCLEDKWIDIFETLERLGIKKPDILPIPKKSEDVKEEKNTNTSDNWFNSTKPPVINLDKNNFITKYVNYASKKSDSYVDYHLAIALSILSVVCERKVFINFTQGRFHTNIWSFIVGMSTVSRKTTAMGEFDEFKKVILQDYMELPSMFSTEALIENAADTPVAIWTLDECGSLLKKATSGKYNADLPDVLCRLYDCKNITRKLRSNKNNNNEFNVIDPYITSLIGTTPSNMACLTQEIIQTGLLYRFLFFNPSYNKPFKTFTEYSDEIIDLRTDLYKHVEKIITRIKMIKEFEFTMDNDVKTWFEKLHMKLEETALKRGDETYAAIIGRAIIYVFKLAMLFAIGSDEFINSDFRKVDTNHIRLKLSKYHLTAALDLITTYFIPMGMRTIRQIEEASKKNSQQMIITALRFFGGKATHRDLLRKVRMKIKDFNETISTLYHETEEITIIEHKTNDGDKILFIEYSLV